MGKEWKKEQSISRNHQGKSAHKARNHTHIERAQRMERGDPDEANRTRGEGASRLIIKRARAQQCRLQEMFSKLNSEDRATLEAINRPQVLRIQALAETSTRDQGPVEVQGLMRQTRTMGQAIKMGLDTRLQQGGWCFPFIVEHRKPRSARPDRSSEIAQHLRSHKAKGKVTETWECKHGHVSVGEGRHDDMQITNECRKEECKTQMHKQMRKQANSKRKRDELEEPSQATLDTSFMECPHGWTRIRGQGEMSSDMDGVECFMDECVKNEMTWGTTTEGEMAMSAGDTNFPAMQEADNERKERERNKCTITRSHYAHL
jgi:hypothetical protein